MQFQEYDVNKLESLIGNVATGDLKSLEELYVLTNTAVYGFALSMMKNKSDAEDIVHDSYLSVLRASANYQAFGKPFAWILKITRNLCLDQLRKQERIVDVAIEDWMLVDHPNAKEDKALLEISFQALSDEEREIVYLHALTGLKFKEIAEVLNKPLTTILSKYHRALKKLKKEMTEKGLYEK